LYVATPDNGLITYAVNPTTGALTSVNTPAPGVFYSVAIHPSGNFAYATAKVGPTPDTVLAYAIDGNGALTAVAGGPFAAGSGAVAVTVDPAGKFAYVANQFSSSVSAYSINATTGALTQVAGSPFATAIGPRALAVDPQSAFLYVSCVGDPTHFGGLSGYSINSSTGALTPLTGSPFHTEFSFGIGIDRSGKFAYEVTGFGNASLRSYAIGGTGSLTPIPGSPLMIAGTAAGVALTR
jgi:DNA-binding beta-propeller fold protein YncE